MDEGPPRGYKDEEELEIRQETPRQMVDRLKSKTGPVAETIDGFCDKSGLDREDAKRIILELGGVVLAAIGRRASRKFPDSDPQELINFEWESATKAYNFVLTVAKALGAIDDYYGGKPGDRKKPTWKELKPRVVARLADQNINSLNNSHSRKEARRQITLEGYSHLEETLRMMVRMTDLGCRRYGVTAESRQELTDEIMQKHYPTLPEYDEKRFPLAYETRVLDLWRELNSTPVSDRT
jgi:hypothetical protein